MSVDIAQLGFRVDSIEAELASRRLDKMTGSARRAQTASERLAKQAAITGKSMQTMGRSMTMFLTAPLLAFAAASVKAFADFDDAMISSMAIMGDLSDTMKKDLAMEARKVAKTTAFSAKQAAESYFFLASAGLDAKASILALSKVAAFAQAGNFDMARATDILTDAQSALGKVMKDPIENMEEMVKLSDVLVKANTIANASVQQFGEALTNKAGTAMKQLNIEVETGVAVLAAWADQGIKSMEAGEKFNIVTRDLQSAYRKNTEEFKRFKVEVFDDGVFRNMADIIKDLEMALGPMSVEMKGATLAQMGFQDRSVIAIKSLIGLSDNIRKYEKHLKHAGGTTQEVADKQMESFSKQLGLMKDEIMDVGIELGGTLAPAVIDLAGDIRDLAKAFQDLEEPTQKLLIKISMFAAIAGPMIWMLGSIIGAVGKIIPLLAKMRTGMILLAVAASPFTLIGAAFTAIALIIANEFVKAMEDASEVTNIFIADLGRLNSIKLDMKGLDAINERLEELKAEQRLLESQIDATTVDASSAGSGMHGMVSDQAAADLAELNLIIEAHIRLRDDYIARIDAVMGAEAQHNELMKRYSATMELLEENMAWLTNLNEVEIDTAAFAELLDYLDPSIEATKEFEAAWALLDKVFASGKMKGGRAELERLRKLLQTSKLAAAAFGNQIKVDHELMARYGKTMKAMEDNFKWLDDLDKLDKELDGLKLQFDPLIAGLEALDDIRKKVQEGFDKGLIDEDQFDRMLEGIDKAESALRGMHSVMTNMLKDSITALGEVRNLFAEDSAEAEALSSVMRVLNVVLGIQAVIKQLSEGDVYSAIPRAIGVAALIASMGVSTGASGGAAAGPTRQESQGTGTILGDAEAKSESILNAMEITADATAELVGINRGMLHALQSMQSGIANVVVSTAQGAGNVDFKPLPDARNDFIDLLFGAGKVDIFGINFIGEFLAKAFGGKVKLLDEGIQIEGGQLTELINEVLVNAFQEISVKKHVFDDTDIKKKFADLDEGISQQFAMIFSSMRDTVEQAAIAIGIPLDDIQSRLAAFEIATQTISLQDLTPEEQQAEIAAVFSAIFDDLASAVVPFIADFQKIGEGLGETLVRVATSVQVFQESVLALGFAADAIGPEAFAHMAVDLVELTGGVENFISQFSTFFDKFASDEQKLEFATSQLTRAFDSVGLTIPDARDGMIDLMQSLDATTDAGRRQIAMLLEIAGVADEYYSLMEDGAEGLTDFIATQRRILADFTGSTIYDGLINLRDGFNQAMDAADSLNATQREYAMIARSFNMQLRRMAAELTITVISMAKQLFGDEMDALDNGLSGGLNGTREIANSVFEEWQRALEDIYDFTQSILLDEGLTTLTPAEQFAEAQSQFDTLLAEAMAGDAEAAAALPDAAQALLEEARFMFASGQEYQKIFESVLAALQGLNMPANITPTIIEEDPTGIDDSTQTENDVLAEELGRFLAALDLAGTLRDLSQVLNDSVIDLAKSLNIPLKELVELLGVELGEISLITAEGLAEVATLLGADIFELLEVLDIGLHDLIAELPDAIQADLAPLLQAIETATTETDSTAAIGDLGDYILDLPADLQTLLAPLFDLFRPVDIAPELGALTGIEENTAATVAAIHALINTMGPLSLDNGIDPADPYNPQKDPPKIQPPVTSPLDALITNTNQTPAETDLLSAEELAQIKNVLTDIRDQDRQYQEADLKVSEEMGSSLKQQTEQTRRIANA